MKKLFITPWFGDFPSWMGKYTEHIKHLEPLGYDWFIPTDLDDFCERIRTTLDIEPNIEPNTSRSHNYRTAFGLLYADKLKDYDFWGLTDFDCVYGKVDNFIPDAKLSELDIHSNHHNYICGPWTLFRNNDTVNNLFRKVPNWKQLMSDTTSHAGRWTEVEYSQTVDQEHDAGNIRRLYTFFQGKDPDIWENLSMKDGALYDGEKEIMMFHFNRFKKWPL